ncbi:MAG: 1,4-alpha-glucan branching protein GlgB [Candidatus Hydrogenedentota bacterium]|nr:MAG: 1,4-alpha-glucan branching protein GlgB [Candidatus Hydrogenedentota bacterium]
MRLLVEATVSVHEIGRILSLNHPDPHSVLGIHPTSAGVIVRAYRPDAVSMKLLIEEKSRVRRVPMLKCHEWGFFEAALPRRKTLFRYRLEIERADGTRFSIRDPYAFLPTVGELDLYFLAEGRHERIYEKLGAHYRRVDNVRGVSFAVWAPNAAGVSVVGEWNDWDARYHVMRPLGASGIREIFIPDLKPGVLYKYEIRTREGDVFQKADPYARYAEHPPKRASCVFHSRYRFTDDDWMAARRKRDPLGTPMTIYEMHLGSWRRREEEGGRPLSYRELAPELGDYLSHLGFTHVELLPVMEYPFDGSWGYQVTGYFAPTSRYGDPDDFRFFIDHLHSRGIGVILDWVPAHFPKDGFALGRFDGTALYEHLDPRQGEHPDWNTFIFNYGRKEVQNFLFANALYWLKEFHADGLRIDAVASMLYLDYSRKPGEWVPNRYGGRENLDAVEFLKRLNEIAHERFPGAMMIAEESTAWPGVSRPTYLGGLGFTFKWNMGWMHDTLHYFHLDPIFRRYHHDNLTFGLVYAWNENFILPFSHDEVVHGKGSLLGKMPGDEWQKFANLRALYAYMWSHPGKKLLFMGNEFAQRREWRYYQALDWSLLDWAPHRGVFNLVRDLNRHYLASPELWERDNDPAGFQWIDTHGADTNTIAFRRISPSTGREMVVIGNFSPVVRHHYRIGLPRKGFYREILNTDSLYYGGSNVGNGGGIQAVESPSHGLPCSATLTLPPLATLWLEVPRDTR